MWLALLAAAASKFKYNIPCKFHFLLSGVLYLQEKKRFYCSKVQASLVFLAKEIVLNCCLKSSIFFKNKVHSNIPLYKKNGWAVVVCPVQNKHLSRHCSPSSSSLLLLLCNFFLSSCLNYVVAKNICSRLRIHFTNRFGSKGDKFQHFFTAVAFVRIPPK